MIWFSMMSPDILASIKIEVGVQDSLNKFLPKKIFGFMVWLPKPKEGLTIKVHLYHCPISLANLGYSHYHTPLNFENV